MHGDVFRGHGQDLLHRPAESRRGVRRQAGDQVHVDRPHTGLPGQGIGPADILGPMAAADGCQDRVGHGLGVDGDPVAAALPDGDELFPGDGVRPASLHGALRARRQLESPAEPVQQLGQLRGLQGGGGPPPR